MKERILTILSRKKWVIAGAVFLLLEVFVITDLIVPAFNSIVETHEVLDKREQKILSVADWESEMTKLRSAEKKLRKSISNLMLQVPESDRVSIITRFLNQTAKKSGVTIDRVQPETHMVDKQQITIPVQLKVSGAYGELGKFVNKLEEARFVIKVEKSNLYKSNLKDNSIHADLLLNWIVLRQKSETE